MSEEILPLDKTIEYLQAGLDRHDELFPLAPDIEGGVIQAVRSALKHLAAPQWVKLGSGVVGAKWYWVHTPEEDEKCCVAKYCKYSGQWGWLTQDYCFVEPTHYLSNPLPQPPEEKR